MSEETRVSETSGLSAAGQKADAALKLLIEARRDCVDPAELERINHAITAAHMVIEPPADRAKELELREPTSTEEDRDPQRVFAEQQRRSHHDLRESDPRFAEYHRGAEVAYALMAERLGGESAAAATGQAWPEGSPERRLIEMRAEIASVPPEAWKGTPPAQGTRRKLILDTLEDFSARLISGAGGKPTSGSCLEAADAIEEALLRVVDQGATPESGSPASVAMDVLDGLGVGRTRDGAILTIADRVTVVADELVERRREMVRSGEKLDEISIPRTSDDAGGSEGSTTLTLNERVYLAAKRVLVEEEAKRLLANTVNAQQTAMDRFKAQRDEARALPAPTPTNDEHIDEFTLTLLACERLHERLTDGPVPNPAELARVIDILR